MDELTERAPPPCLGPMGVIGSSAGLGAIIGIFSEPKRSGIILGRMGITAGILHSVTFHGRR